MRLLKEVLWIIIALLVAAIVQFKITETISYKFYLENTLVIFISVFYTRIAVDLKNMFFIKNKWFKYFFIVFNLFLFIFVVTRLQKVIILYDVFSITSYSNTVVYLDNVTESNLIHYIHREFLFFSFLALVSIFILNSKIIVSFWKK